MRRYLGLRLLVSVRFQILFHRPPGLLFTFPSRYLFTIDHEKYLALRHSRRGFTRDFSGPALLSETYSAVPTAFAYRTFTFFGGSSQILLLTAGLFLHRSDTSAPRRSVQHLPCNGSHLYPTPAVRILLSILGAPDHMIGLGFSPFARHYSGNRVITLRPPFR